MKIKTKEKIDEMLISVEKKIHAGEWVRIEVVRRLLNELVVWMNEMYYLETIKKLQQERHSINKEEEE